MLVGYARVSKAEDQSTVAQRRALESAGVQRLYEDIASGGRFDRPQLHLMIEALQAGDVVVVWKLDRLSRSLKDLLQLLEQIEGAGAGFRSLTEAIDTTTPSGRMMMQLLGAFAEFERAMVRERTLAGLAAARAAGKTLGSRPKFDEQTRALIVREVVDQGATLAATARRYGVSTALISKICAPHRPAPRPFRRLTAEERAYVITAVRSGERTGAEMARHFGVSGATISNVLKVLRMQAAAGEHPRPPAPASAADELLRDHARRVRYRQEASALGKSALSPAADV